MPVDYLYVAGFAGALLAGALTGRGAAILVPLGATVFAFLAGYIAGPSIDGWGTAPQAMAVYWGVPMTLLAAAGVAVNRIVRVIPARAGSAPGSTPAGGAGSGSPLR
jgi:hypothetical protein